MTEERKQIVAQRLRELGAATKQPLHDGKGKVVYPILDQNGRIGQVPRVAEVFKDFEAEGNESKSLRVTYALFNLFACELGIPSHMYDVYFDSGILVADFAHPLSEKDGQRQEYEWTGRNTVSGSATNRLGKEGDDLTRNGHALVEQRLKHTGKTEQMFLSDAQVQERYGMKPDIFADCQEDTGIITDYMTDLIQNSVVGRKHNLKLHDLTLEFGTKKIGNADSVMLIGGFTSNSFRISTREKRKEPERLVTNDEKYEYVVAAIKERMRDLSMEDQFVSIFGKTKKRAILGIDAQKSQLEATKNQPDAQKK